MQPLKVTFRFSSPVVMDSEYGIHLDGLLAWAVADEAERFGSSSAWEDAQDLHYLLEKAEDADSGEWVWKASQVIFQPASERFFFNMIRKADPLTYLEGIDAGHIHQRRERSYIDTQSGSLRAYQLLAPYQWMEKAECWCIGDQEAIQEHLAHVTSLGKMRRNGYGALASIVVEPDPAAITLWKLRTLPVGMTGAPGHQYAETLQCLSAPYWDRRKRVMAKEPILMPGQALT